MNGKADITVGPTDIAERKETSVLAQALFIICCMQTDTGFHFDFFSPKFGFRSIYCSIFICLLT